LRQSLTAAGFFLGRRLKPVRRCGRGRASAEIDVLMNASGVIAHSFSFAKRGTFYWQSAFM
jgi:hypothetical protein